MSKMDGTIRNALGHELMAKYLTERGYERSVSEVKTK